MSTASLVYRVRRMLGDFGAPFTAGVKGNGIVSMIDLNAAPVEPLSIVTMTTINDGASWSTLTLGVDYTIDPKNGKLLFPTPPPTGMYIAVRGLKYDDWTDMDVLDFIDIAMAQHTYHRDPPVYLEPRPGPYPTQLLPPVEENLAAMLAVIEAYWALATEKAQNFTIDTGDGTVIPLPQQYEHIMSHIDKLMLRYQHQSNLLGVGLYAIEVYDIRRVSRVTGCLVPLYKDMELEERYRPPDRVLPPKSIPADVIIHFAGIWNQNERYRVNDEVLYQGYTYVALRENCGLSPVQDEMNAATGVDTDNDGDNDYVRTWKITTINNFGGFWNGYAW